MQLRNCYGHSPKSTYFEASLFFHQHVQNFLIFILPLALCSWHQQWNDYMLCFVTASSLHLGRHFLFGAMVVIDSLATELLTREKPASLGRHLPSSHLFLSDSRPQGIPEENLLLIFPKSVSPRAQCCSSPPPFTHQVTSSPFWGCFNSLFLLVVSQWILGITKAASEEINLVSVSSLSWIISPRDCYPIGTIFSPGLNSVYYCSSLNPPFNPSYFSSVYLQSKNSKSRGGAKFLSDYMSDTIGVTLKLTSNS